MRNRSRWLQELTIPFFLIAIKNGRFPAAVFCFHAKAKSPRIWLLNHQLLRETSSVQDNGHQVRAGRPFGDGQINEV